jgi:hypothetical protein
MYYTVFFTAGRKALILRRWHHRDQQYVSKYAFYTDNFDEVINFYKENIREPLFISSYPLEEEEKKVIAEIWYNYGDLQ